MIQWWAFLKAVACYKQLSWQANYFEHQKGVVSDLIHFCSWFVFSWILLHLRRNIHLFSIVLLKPVCPKSVHHRLSICQPVICWIALEWVVFTLFINFGTSQILIHPVSQTNCHLVSYLSHIWTHSASIHLFILGGDQSKQWPKNFSGTTVDSWNYLEP